jgi:hypothetical protein
VSLVAYGYGLEPGYGSGSGAIIRNATIVMQENRFTVDKSVNQFSVAAVDRSNTISLTDTQSQAIAASIHSFVIQVPNRKQVT